MHTGNSPAFLAPRGFIITMLVLVTAVTAQSNSTTFRRLVEHGLRTAPAAENHLNGFERAMLKSDPGVSLAAALRDADPLEVQDARKILAYRSLAAGDGNGVVQFATQLLMSVESPSFEAQYLLAQGELLTGRIKSAEARMDWLSRNAAQPWRGFGLYGQAQAALLRPDTTEAIRLLKLCAAMSGHDATAPALYLLGKLHEAQGRSQAAVRYLTIYREAYPDGLIPVLEVTPKGSARADEAAGIYYAIQVGVFRERTNGLRQKDRFEALGYRVRLVPRKVAGNTYTAVWVGRFSSQRTAQDVRRSLEQKTDDTYRVIVIE